MNNCLPRGKISLSFIITLHQVYVLRLIQVVRSVEKIEKILHSQNSKESTTLEISRWGTGVWSNPLASLNKWTTNGHIELARKDPSSKFAYLSFVGAVVLKTVYMFCYLVERLNFWTKIQSLDRNYVKTSRDLIVWACCDNHLCVSSCPCVCVQSFVSRSDPGEDSYRIQPATIPCCTEQRHAPAGQS